MTVRRYLDTVPIKDYDKITLTDEEQLEWHFCWDWDGLLIHKSSPEFECCSCRGGDHIRNATDSRNTR
jgi:hypothetical protein